MSKEDLYRDKKSGVSKWFIIKEKLLSRMAKKDSATGRRTVPVKLTEEESRLGEIFLLTKEKPGKPGKPAKKESVVMLDEDKRQNVLLSYDPSTQKLKDLNGDIVDTYIPSRADSPVSDHSATSSETSSKSTKNMFKYVISPSGELYAASKSSFEKGSLTSFSDDLKMPVGSLSHAGFLQGMPVIAAGMIEITDGKITYIDNDSGHYKPKGFNVYNGISLLKKKMEGVFDDNCIVGNRVFTAKSKKTQESQVGKIVLAKESEITQKSLAEAENFYKKPNQSPTKFEKRQKFMNNFFEARALKGKNSQSR